MFFKFQSKTLDPKGNYAWDLHTLVKLGKFRITYCKPTWNFGIMFYNRIGGVERIRLTICLFEREIGFVYN